MRLAHEDLVHIVERSSTLLERLDGGYVLAEPREGDAKLAARLVRWRDVVSRGDEALFRKRLEWDGLDHDRCVRALAGARLADAAALPGWTAVLTEVAEAAATLAAEEAEREAHPGGEPRTLDRCLNAEGAIPFEGALLPFVHVARARLAAAAGPLLDRLAPYAQAGLERRLLLALASACGQSLQLEFSIVRTLRVGSLGNGSEKPGDSLYRSFVRGMLEGGLASFLAEYPVLARLASTAVLSWVDANLEYLRRLDADLPAIAETFGDDGGGVVARVRTGISDPHRGGRFVVVTEFASGLKLVYKPRETGLEKGYNDLLGWLNASGAPFGFRTFRVLDRGTHGWAEFVEHEPCADRAAAERFYQRGGALLCLVYALSGADFHYENVIAAGEHPVLVDMEMLMCPPFRVDPAQAEWLQAFTRVGEQFRSTVLSTLLLPAWRRAADGEAYDVSGLSGGLAGSAPVKVLVWHDVNTDAMGQRREERPPQRKANAPMLEGEPLSPAGFLDAVVEGFERMYRFLARRRAALTAPGGPLETLRGRRVRFLARSTSVYTTTLARSFHPRNLRDGADRSLELEVMARGLVSLYSRPFFWPFVRAEQRALDRLDVPFFTNRSDGDVLELDEGEEVERCFEESGWEAVRGRLDTLARVDLALQSGLIRASFHARDGARAHQEAEASSDGAGAGEAAPLTPGAAVAEAVALGEDLRRQAISLSDGTVTWFVMGIVADTDRRQLQPIDLGLHDGRVGVALFLAALHRATREAAWRDLALLVLRPLRQGLEDPVFRRRTAERLGVGGTMGMGSLVYALTRSAGLLEEPALLGDAGRAAEALTPALLAADTHLDVVAGTAGALLGLLALYAATGNEPVLAWAAEHGRHLLARRRADSVTGLRAWETSKGRLLTGFSHGSAGIAHALLALHRATGEAAFREAALEAMAFEASLFVPGEDNWPFFRGAAEHAGYARLWCTWCRGAPGVGLSRASALDVGEEGAVRRELDAALRTTLSHPQQPVDHLCCGNLGRAEFLFSAAERTGDPALREAALGRAGEVVARARSRGGYALNGDPLYSPGFFQGRAGIGYQLLRMADPACFPSVLAFQ